MELKEAKRASVENLARSVRKALEERGFRSCLARDAREARTLALDLIPPGASVGVPGSVTVRETGLLDALAERNCKIYEHWKEGMTPEERAAALASEMLADWFVTSANALSADGVIVNIDGAGNRVGAMSWAPGKILYIIGANKITTDVRSAVRRARDVASPANALRLSRKTPCTVAGRCMDCKSAERICRVLTLIERAPIGRECHVIIVEEALGY